MDALPYQEPPVGTILSLSSFLLSLHIVAWPLDRLCSCGLIGQIFVGVIWVGLPQSPWLALDIQNAIVQFGYLGLILLVYEGGLSTDLRLLKSSIVPALFISITGVILPIALSFLLIPIFSPTSVEPLNAFAAGVALSSTSLGTTFTILSAANLNSTKIGTILITAAIIDDVIGLVMVGIIPSLSNLDTKVLSRQIGVSLALLLVVFLLSRLAKAVVDKLSFNRLERWVDQIGFVLTALWVLSATAAAGYAGTSILFAAYLAGVSASYLSQSIALKCYEKFFHRITHGLLVPLFFASIGFAIPIRQLFSGGVVWRGIVYAILMAFAKGVTSVWLVVLPLLHLLLRKLILTCRSLIHRILKILKRRQQSPVSSSVSAPTVAKEQEPPPNETSRPLESAPTITSNVTQRNIRPRTDGETDRRDETPTISHKLNEVLLVGFAMISRGEIGFLIAGVAQTTNVLIPVDLYLVVIWGILICTLIGPICVGMIVRKMEMHV